MKARGSDLFGQEVAELPLSCYCCSAFILLRYRNSVIVVLVHDVES